MGYYSFYRIIKDILYNLKKNKLLVIVAIIILVLFLCNNVFASIISYTLKSGNEDTFSLNVDIPNHILNINNVSVASGVWDYDNMAFVNSANNIGFIIVWNGNLIIKNNDAFVCDTNFRCLEFTYFMENTYPGTQYSIATPFYKYKDTNNYRVGNKQLFNPNNYVFSTADIYDNNGNVIIKNNNIKYPQITNSLEDLQTLNFDTISVSAWDWSDKDLYILFYDRTLMNNQNTEGLYPKKEIKLTKDTSYYIPEISSEENAIYWVANDNTGLNFKVGGKYEIRLAERVPQSTGRWFSWR